MLIEGYIIDKLRREKEDLERQQWQPIPLPLEEYEPRNRDEKEREKKPEKPGEVVIELRLSGAINGYPARNLFCV